MAEANGRDGKRNVIGGPLGICGVAPTTGFYRSGCCETGPDDVGAHVVCAQMTEEFLFFSLGQGNDLVTPRPQMGFGGLKPGDRWCVCAARWRDALEAGVAPPVYLSATHEAALQYVAFEDLLRFAIDIPDDQ
jgi:uncharacterized protein (DUF2237 family)